MTSLLQALVNGAFLASVYSLIAVGFVVIYKASGVVSLGQPVFLALGAYLTSYFCLESGMNFFAAVAVSVLATGAVAVVVERTILRPLVGEPVLSAVVVTVGVYISGDVIVDRLIGVTPRSVGDPWGFKLISVGGVDIAHRTIASLIIAAIVVGGLVAFFSRARTGVAMRAASYDQEAALAHGIPVGRVFAISWFFAGALAALGGTLAGTGGAGVDTDSAALALAVLPVLILGGIDSIGGALVGAFTIGFTQALVTIFQPDVAPWLGATFVQVVPYIVMILVLIVRPYGLFGTPEVERI